jgi:hypothetical protein
MDTNNIKFLGYGADGLFQKACKQRENPMNLQCFFNAVNQDTTNGCCSCCKQDGVVVYAVMQWGLPIKPNSLSLCVNCVRKLPLALKVHNLGSNGAPPMLGYKINNSEV